MYGAAAQLWRINRGRRRRADTDQLGFLLDVDRGYWGNDADEPADDDEPTGPRMRRVIPFVEYTRNCLLIKPVEDLDAAALASLEAAVNPALQVAFHDRKSTLLTS